MAVVVHAYQAEPVAEREAPAAMSDRFHPAEDTVRFRRVLPPETAAEQTVQFPAVPPESPAEQTTVLVLFSTPRHRPLHDWMAAQMPEPQAPEIEPLWPDIDPDS
ncbi:hypothetical protein AB5J62_33445 [Amycolatopsis sp. cg5]|uniref:hypothetical protein n=1 Tax=Amycolatopsis sp. cg5 TaxID=3238802 RepID=UPI003526A988